MAALAAAAPSGGEAAPAAGEAAPAAGWSALEWRAFPPLYTLQPVAETRAQQLRVWVSVVHAWAAEQKSATFAPRGAAVFESAACGRRLDDAGVAAVVDALVADGRAETLDDGRIFLLAERPAALAARILDWATATGKLGGVYTVRELRDPEAAADDAPARGADARLVARALAVLEDQDRCQVFSGATSSDAGVKFFAADR